MQPLSSSYRDNDGYVFNRDGKIYRCIRASYFSHLQLLQESGLYKKLTSSGQLIPHEEVHEQWIPEGTKVILPEQINFITYPYEWSFDMWKDAALLTLSIVNKSLQKGMTLKDATPFNIQFHKGKALFIDTLSFEKYNEGEPWIAYRQFCECFLAPLLLMHYCHRDAAKIFLAWPNGIPSNVLKTLLPGKAKWNLHVYLHVWLRSKVSKDQNETQSGSKQFTKQKLLLLIKGLEQLVSGLKQIKSRSVWDNYYTDTILGDKYLSAKSDLVTKFAALINYKTVTDLGANDGFFSMLLKDTAINIKAVDSDSNCINTLYLDLKRSGVKNITPIVNELNNPSPAIGWNNAERSTMSDRLRSDLVLALALVHHLALAYNVPLSFIAEWLRPMCNFLIIEFVPKSDEKVKQLLLNREDIFESYSAEGFRNAFGKYFNIIKEEKVGETDRILFLMENKQPLQS